MKKVAGVKHVRFNPDQWVNDAHPQAIAAALFGWCNFRRHGRRGMVGEPPDARDGRSVFHLPDFDGLHDAWEVLNYFADCRDVLVRTVFFDIIDPDLLAYHSPPNVAAQEIASAAITTILHMIKTRGYF